MAHEIKQHDGLILHKRAAWHGLGTIVEEAPTPMKALELAGLDWEPLESDSMFGTFADNDEGTPMKVACSTHKMLVRSDHPEVVLGIVGENYTPISNIELADLCYDLCEEWMKEHKTQVRCESAGSLFNGKKVWFLLQADPFEVAGHDGDVVHPYTLAFNGFDGLTSMSMMPTTVRVVCNNTLTAALRRGGSGIKIKHTTNVKQRLADAMRSLSSSTESLDGMRDEANAMGAAKIDAPTLQRLWLDVYQNLNGRVDEPNENSPSGVKQKYARMVTTLGDWTRNFDREVTAHGWDRTVWTGFNAITNSIEHSAARSTSKVRDGIITAEDSRVNANLFGSRAKTKATAAKVALTYC